jgi:hypothetical protein
MFASRRKNLGATEGKESAMLNRALIQLCSLPESCAEPQHEFHVCSKVPQQQDAANENVATARNELHKNQRLPSPGEKCRGKPSGKSAQHAAQTMTRSSATLVCRRL